jgi:ParB family chromosome partitioning protein
MNTAAPDPKRRALGKGLDSLIPRAQTPAAPSGENEGGRPREIPLDQIERNPFQTRSQVNEGQLAEMAASITANGVVQPVLVRPLANGRFQLIAGERRWKASQLAGKATIPAILRQVSDEQAMEITIVENLQRADLNPMEQTRVPHDAGTDGGAHGQGSGDCIQLFAFVEVAFRSAGAGGIRRAEFWSCAGAAGI